MAQARRQDISPDQRLKHSVIARNLAHFGKEKAPVTKKTKVEPLQNQALPLPSAADKDILSIAHHPHIEKIGISKDLWNNSDIHQRRAVLDYIHNGAPAKPAAAPIPAVAAAPVAAAPVVAQPSNPKIVKSLNSIKTLIKTLKQHLVE